MRVKLTQKRVIGHVMRYPGEVVDLPEPVTPEPVTPDHEGAEEAAVEIVAVDEGPLPESVPDFSPAPKRGRKAVQA